MQHAATPHVARCAAGDAGRLRLELFDSGSCVRPIATAHGVLFLVSPAQYPPPRSSMPQASWVSSVRLCALAGRAGALGSVAARREAVVAAWSRAPEVLWRPHIVRRPCLPLAAANTSKSWGAHASGPQVHVGCRMCARSVRAPRGHAWGPPRALGCIGKHSHVSLDWHMCCGIKYSVRYSFR